MVILRTLLVTGPLSSQTRTKLRKSLKGILNCCKLQVVFKSQNKLSTAFRFKDRIPKSGLALSGPISFSVDSGKVRKKSGKKFDSDTIFFLFS